MGEENNEKKKNVSGKNARDDLPIQLVKIV